MTSRRIPGHVERVGILGGSFDPIHLGHLLLAQAALEELNLERILFVPAGLSPFKTDAPPAASPSLRLEMLQAAIAGEPRFGIDDRELRREGPSYTIDTVTEMLGDYPGVRFLYLIGTDHLRDLDHWHRIGELRNLVDFAVLDRGGASAVGTDLPVVRRRVDLSSTEIRARAAEGLSIRFMVPEAVYEIIMTRSPYSTPTHARG
jgi:nicotinate-nucleotide adenylyltransferase